LESGAKGRMYPIVYTVHNQNIAPCFELRKKSSQKLSSEKVQLYKAPHCPICLCAFVSPNKLAGVGVLPIGNDGYCCTTIQSFRTNSSLFLFKVMMLCPP
jgi:hypothetical protein